VARVKRGVAAHKRHKKVLELAKGFSGTHNRLFRPANEAVMHALSYQ
jgi:large subunit ribosomal protein L20